MTTRVTAARSPLCEVRREGVSHQNWLFFVNRESPPRAARRSEVLNESTSEVSQLLTRTLPELLDGVAELTGNALTLVHCSPQLLLTLLPKATPAMTHQDPVP